MELKNDTIIGTRGPKVLAEKLSYHAKANDLTSSQVIRKLLREWVEEQDKKHKRQLTLTD